MPPRGKCESCGRVTFLTAKVLTNRETGEMQCFMLCGLCKCFYENGGIECDGRTDEDGIRPNS